MAIYSLTHRTIGRTTHAAGTARAHMNYITRPNACDHALSEKMPLNRHAVKRWTDEHEESLRKNGRVCDKFVIALPAEMDLKESVDLVRDFGNRLSRGRAPFFAAFHDMESHNPHCHFVFFDRDTETKQRVAKLSSKGSTERVRQLWEETTNEHLERGGYDARIDRRTLEEQGIDRIPEEHRGFSNDNEEDLGRIDNESLRKQPALFAKAGQLKRTWYDYQDLKLKRDEVARLREVLPIHQQSYGVAKAEAAREQRRLEVAEESLNDKTNRAAEFVKDNGKLKGWGIKIFGFEYQSPTRKQGIHAKEELDTQQLETDSIKQEYSAKESVHQKRQEDVAQTVESLRMYERRLQAYGSEEHQEHAETVLAESAKQLSSEIDYKELDLAHGRGDMETATWEACHEAKEQFDQEIEQELEADKSVDEISR